MAYRKLKRWAGLLLVVGSLSLIYQGSITGHMRRSADPLCFKGDARQWIWPLFRYTGQSHFEGDYVGDYYLFALTPVGYRSLYAGLAGLLEPAALSKVLPYVLLLIVLIASALSAGKFGGMAAAWAAAALVLSSGLFLSMVGGGLPRSFALPLFACAAAAAIYGRAYLLAFLVISAAAFYPPTAVSGGIALALLLLALPAADRGEAARWSLKRRVAVVAATGLLSALLVLPMALGSRAYGPVVRPDEVALYPEAGPGGRFSKKDLAFQKGLPENLSNYVLWTFAGAGEPWSETLSGWIRRWADEEEHSRRQDAILLIILAFIVSGMAWLCWRRAAGRRLVVLAGAVFLAYEASRLLYPYLFLPNRHLKRSIPILATVMFVAFAASLGDVLESITKRRWLKPVSVLAVSVLALAFIGGRGSTKAGLEHCVDENRKVYTALSRLPAESLVAGWPAGLMDDVPYVSRRRVFLTFETHISFHKGYLEETRKRMNALIDAYFATEAGPLLRLRDEFGVTHLVVNEAHFRKDPPSYFEPFDQRIRKAHARGLEEGFVLLELINEAGTRLDGPYALLDLREL